MSLVVEVISEYLQTNRRLVVPGFGAFMVKESGEKVFSNLLNTDDGVLLSLLRAKGLTEMEAAVVIDRFIFEMRYDLEQYDYYRLGEIGTLRIEPDTRVLRLYPPVQGGEMPKHTPFVPKPISVAENEEHKAENEKVTEEQKVEIPTPNTSNTPTTPTTPKRPIKPRKKFDFVVVLAIIIVLAAVAAIGYGYYVSTLAEVDDAAIDALRVVPGQTINE